MATRPGSVYEVGPLAEVRGFGYVQTVKGVLSRSEDLGSFALTVSQSRCSTALEIEADAERPSIQFNQTCNGLVLSYLFHYRISFTIVFQHLS